MRLYVRFQTAWAALVFAGQLPGSPDCLRGGPGDSWWIGADLALETAQEMVSVGAGDIYRPRGALLIRSRDWGGNRDQGETIPRDGLRTVPMLQLIRTAGLHPCPPRPLAEAVLLLPGHLVGGITRRALDLQLDTSYRPVGLSPLFEQDPLDRVCYELSLRTRGETALPAFLMAALDRDPFILVCRRAGETVLMRYQMTSPLPDSYLVSLSGGETWVFADSSHGCARLQPLGEARDGNSLVRRGRDHELVDVTPEAGWAEPAGIAAEPAPPELTLARARMNGMPVDAALLDDADLGCLPSLLAGEPLAEAAVVIRGRDRHLLTAPGGLLEQLPVGEPLYCLGPGSLYVPLGYRLRPMLPPAAREELFPTSKSTAIVLLPGAALRYDLSARAPVWTLWAGPPPLIDDQLPPEVLAELRSLDPEADPAKLDPATSPGLDRHAASASAPRTSTPVTDRPSPAAPSAPGARLAASRTRGWRDEAYEAELAGDYAAAAELHLQHNDPLRAARLYERAAESA